MGMFDWFRSKKPSVAERFEGIERGYWPQDVPLTEETLKIAAQTHHIYSEAFNVAIKDDDDEQDWRPLGSTSNGVPRDPARLREDLRDLSLQPNCRRALNLYRYYLAGNGFAITLKPVGGAEQTEAQKKFVRRVDRLWREFLLSNVPGFSFDEWVNRTYRDGEVFLHLQEEVSWPPVCRFIDPEEVRDKDGDESAGIITKPGDVATYVRFLRVLDEGQKPQAIDAKYVIFQKIDTDSTVKRGIGRLAGGRDNTRMLMGTIRNEVILRNLQSSIVLQRKVAGGRGPALGIMDHARTSTTDYPEGTIDRQKIRPGSILTTTKGVEVEFKQPVNNFSDASPLIAVLIQQLASLTGWTYEQLSADTSRGNLASALSQESPTLQMVKAEMAFHAPYIERLYRWVMGMAAATANLEMTEEQLWEDYEVDVRFGDPTSKDPLKEAQRVGNSTLAQIISRAEARRQLGVSNEQMVREIKEENESGLYLATANQMGDAGDRAGSQASNVSGGGTNQGDGDPISHTDNRGAKGGSP